MSDWSQQLAPVVKWVIIAALAFALWHWAPDIYQWLKSEAVEWKHIITS